MHRLIDANAFLDKALKRYTERERGRDLLYTACEVKQNLADMICEAPTVDAVEVDTMREFAADVVYQFGDYGHYNGRLHVGNSGLSTLEWAFDILGWENPHPVPELECEIEGCHEHATCGTPTADGYKRMCGIHYRNHCAIFAKKED